MPSRRDASKNLVATLNVSVRLYSSATSIGSLSVRKGEGKELTGYMDGWLDGGEGRSHLARGGV